MDTFNIETIEKLIASECEIEISDISTIIKSMISMKSDKEYTPSKKYKPYNILDKVNINDLSKNNRVKIKKYHDDNFDLIEDSLDCIQEYEACIKKDLFDYYWDVYWRVLEKLNIEYDDIENIRKNSDEIYLLINNNIKKEVFDGKKTDISSNKIVTYVEAITAYVFYKCKFLIPIEGVIVI